MTPRERAEATYLEWMGGGIGLVDAYTAAITSAISDQTAALQAALEDLARTKQERDRYKGAASYVYSTRRRLRLLYEVVTGQPMRVSLSDSEAVDEFDAAVRRLKFDFTVMQDAREELARVTRERDGLAAALAKSKKHARAAKVFAHEVAGSPRSTVAESDRFDDLVLTLEKWSIGINVEAILAAHDRAVAARVLREAEGYVVKPIECSTLLRLADQYERGEREVPSEYSR